MIAKINLVDKNITSLLKTMVVIIDTREQKNEHIIKYLEKKKINYIVKKLEFGDYSCMIPSNDELNMPFDLSLENSFAVEKKNSLEEISGNLTNGRTEFNNEFLRARDKKCKVHLLVENGSWEKIAAHDYKTNFNEKSFYNSMLSFIVKYNISLHFVSREHTPYHIVNVLRLELRNQLKY